MNQSKSVTQWLSLLHAGDEAATQELWSRYIEKLVALAKRKLGDMPRRYFDEEDIASMAFAAFFRGVSSGRFSKLQDRSDLWQILVMLTDRRAVDQIRSGMTAKRGAGKVRGDSAFLGLDESTNDHGQNTIACPEPTPAFAMEFGEQVQVHLHALDSDKLRTIALAKMEGYTNAEIAARLGASVSTVERKLVRIRSILEKSKNAESI